MVLTKLYLISLIDFLTLGLLMPVAGIHVLELGGSRFIIGVLSSMHCLFQLVTGPIIGSLSDTKGRKPLLLKSLLLCLISNLLLTINSLYVYIFSRIIYGFGCHVQVLLKPLVTDNVPASEQPGEFAKMGALAGIAFIVAPIIGGHITEYDNGFYYLASLICGLTVLHIGVTLSLPEDKISKTTEIGEETGIFTNLSKIKWNLFWDIFTFKLLGESTFSMFFLNFGLILFNVFHSSQKDLGYVIAFFSLTTIASNLALKNVKSRYYKNDTNARIRNMHGLFGIASVFGLLYLAPNFWAYVILMAPLAFFKTLLDDTWIETLLKRSDDGEKGTVMGAYEGVLQLAGLAMPIISGFIGEMFELNAINLFCTIPVLFGALLATTIKLPNKTKIN